jgi:hypothetical protein
MSIIQLATAKSQVRITQTAEDSLLQGYLDAAETSAARYLNRNLYADAPSLATAITTANASLAPTQAAYDAARQNWLTALDEWQQPILSIDVAQTGPGLPDSIAWEIAQHSYVEAVENARMALYGIVMNTPITQAVLLTFAHFSNNREAVLTDAAKAVELPMGVQMLLNPYRVREGV